MALEDQHVAQAYLEQLNAAQEAGNEAGIRLLLQEMANQSPEVKKAIMAIPELTAIIEQFGGQLSQDREGRPIPVHTLLSLHEDRDSAERSGTSSHPNGEQKRVETNENLGQKYPKTDFPSPYPSSHLEDPYLEIDLADNRIKSEVIQELQALAGQGLQDRQRAIGEMDVSRRRRILETVTHIELADDKIKKVVEDILFLEHPSLRNVFGRSLFGSYGEFSIPDFTKSPLEQRAMEVLGNTRMTLVGADSQTIRKTVFAVLKQERPSQNWRNNLTSRISRTSLSQSSGISEAIRSSRKPETCFEAAVVVALSCGDVRGALDLILDVENLVQGRDFQTTLTGFQLTLQRAYTLYPREGKIAYDAAMLSHSDQIQEKGGNIKSLLSESERRLRRYSEFRESSELHECGSIVATEQLHTLESSKIGEKVEQQWLAAERLDTELVGDELARYIESELDRIVESRLGNYFSREMLRFLNPRGSTDARYRREVRRSRGEYEGYEEPNVFNAYRDMPDTPQARRDLFDQWGNNFHADQEALDIITSYNSFSFRSIARMVREPDNFIWKLNQAIGVQEKKNTNGWDSETVLHELGERVLPVLYFLASLAEHPEYRVVLKKKFGFTETDMRNLPSTIEKLKKEVFFRGKKERERYIIESISVLDNPWASKGDRYIYSQVRGALHNLVEMKKIYGNEFTDLEFEEILREIERTLTSAREDELSREDKNSLYAIIDELKPQVEITDTIKSEAIDAVRHEINRAESVVELLEATFALERLDIRLSTEFTEEERRELCQAIRAKLEEFDQDSRFKIKQGIRKFTDRVESEIYRGTAPINIREIRSQVDYLVGHAELVHVSLRRERQELEEQVLREVGTELDNKEAQIQEGTSQIQQELEQLTLQIEQLQQEEGALAPENVGSSRITDLEAGISSLRGQLENLRTKVFFYDPDKDRRSRLEKEIQRNQDLLATERSTEYNTQKERLENKIEGLEEKQTELEERQKILQQQQERIRILAGGLTQVDGTRVRARGVIDQ